MHKASYDYMTQRKYLPLILFLLGFGTFLFTRRSELVPTISWAIIIAPIFVLRFIRTQPTKKGILLTLFGFILSMNLALWGLFKVSDVTIGLIFNLTRSSLLGILYFLPYLADRLIYPKFEEKGIISTLIFPVAVTAIFFLFSLEGPFDGDSVFAVFTYGNLLFKQVASIAGLWGFVFIFSWFASLINHAWEKNFEWKKIKKITFIFLLIILMIFSFGAVKTSSLMSPDSDTVKIASIILIPENEKAVSLESIWENKIISDFDKTISRIESLTKEAVSNNAKIVALQEYSITVNEENENKLIDEVKRIAKESNIYFSITYGFFKKEGKGKNKQLFINDRGEIEIEYVKRFPLGFAPFGETGIMEKGPGVIQITDTPYGRIGVVICRDMSFPPYIRQAGKKDVDIMLAPAYAWPKSTGPSYYLRTIENGFSYIRPTYNGISFAADYNGRILTKMDSDDTKDGIMYADVPTKGVRTIYSTIGDLFAWLCVLGLLGFIVVAIREKRKNK